MFAKPPRACFHPDQRGRRVEKLTPREDYVAEAGAVIALYALAVDPPIARSSATGERVVTASTFSKGRGAGSDLGGNHITPHIRIGERAAS